MIRFSYSNKDTKDEKGRESWSARDHHHASPQESTVAERATLTVSSLACAGVRIEVSAKMPI
jgi:hypothetical protein